MIACRAVFIYHTLCYCISHLFLNRLSNIIESIPLFGSRYNGPLETGLRNPNLLLLFIKTRFRVKFPPTSPKQKTSKTLLVDGELNFPEIVEQPLFPLKFQRRTLFSMTLLYLLLYLFFRFP